MAEYSSVVRSVPPRGASLVVISQELFPNTFQYSKGKLYRRISILGARISKFFGYTSFEHKKFSNKVISYQRFKQFSRQDLIEL